MFVIERGKLRLLGFRDNRRFEKRKQRPSRHQIRFIRGRRAEPLFLHKRLHTARDMCVAQYGIRRERFTDAADKHSDAPVSIRATPWELNPWRGREIFASCGFCGPIRSEILHGDCVDVLRDFDGERQKMMRRLHKIRANFDNKR